MEKFIDEMQHLTKTIKIQSQKDKKMEKEEKTIFLPAQPPDQPDEEEEKQAMEPGQK